MIFFTNNVWMTNVICIMVIIDHDKDFGYSNGGGDGEYEYTTHSQMFQKVEYGLPAKI